MRASADNCFAGSDTLYHLYTAEN